MEQEESKEDSSQRCLGRRKKKIMSGFDDGQQHMGRINLPHQINQCQRGVVVQ